MMPLLAIALEKGKKSKGKAKAEMSKPSPRDALKDAYIAIKDGKAELFASAMEAAIRLIEDED